MNRDAKKCVASVMEVCNEAMSNTKEAIEKVVSILKKAKRDEENGVTKDGTYHQVLDHLGFKVKDITVGAAMLVHLHKMDIGYVAEQMRLVPTLRLLSGSELDENSKKVLRLCLKKNGYEHQLRGCISMLDLARKGIPYVLSDGTMKLVEEMTDEQVRNALGVAKSGFLAVKRSTKKVTYKNYQEAVVDKILYAGDQGDIQTRFVLQSLRERSNKLSVSVEELSAHCKAAGVKIVLG